jgi:hypothetical protein
MARAELTHLSAVLPLEYHVSCRMTVQSLVTDIDACPAAWRIRRSIAKSVSPQPVFRLSPNLCCALGKSMRSFGCMGRRLRRWSACCALTVCVTCDGWLIRRWRLGSLPTLVPAWPLLLPPPPAHKSHPNASCALAMLAEPDAV